MSHRIYKVNFPKTYAYEQAKTSRTLKEHVTTIDMMIETYRQSDVQIAPSLYQKLISLLPEHMQKEARLGMNWHYARVTPA